MTRSFRTAIFRLIFLPSGQFAWSAFSPVTMDLDVLDGTESTFVYGSTRCTPDPWHEVPMGMRRNDLWIIHSLLVHWGGGIPKALDLPAPGDMDALPRVVAFCGLSTVPVDYDVTDPVVPPPWARREAEAVGKEVCGVVSCRRKVGGSSARCFGCKQALLCGTHKGVLCTACDEPANEAPAAQPSNALPSHFPTMLTAVSIAQRGNESSATGPPAPPPPLSCFPSSLLPSLAFL